MDELKRLRQEFLSMSRRLLQQGDLFQSEFVKYNFKDLCHLVSEVCDKLVALCEIVENIDDRLDTLERR